MRTRYPSLTDEQYAHGYTLTCFVQWLAKERGISFVDETGASVAAAPLVESYITGPKYFLAEGASADSAQPVQERATS